MTKIYSDDKVVGENNPLPTKVTGSYVGYSTDDKSTIAPNAKRGDSFLELDTKDIYFFDGSDWVVW